MGMEAKNWKKKQKGEEKRRNKFSVGRWWRDWEAHDDSSLKCGVKVRGFAPVFRLVPQTTTRKEGVEVEEKEKVEPSKCLLYLGHRSNGSLNTFRAGPFHLDSPSAFILVPVVWLPVPVAVKKTLIICSCRARSFMKWDGKLNYSICFFIIPQQSSSSCPTRWNLPLWSPSLSSSLWVLMKALAEVVSHEE